MTASRFFTVQTFGRIRGADIWRVNVVLGNKGVSLKKTLENVGAARAGVIDKIELVLLGGPGLKLLLPFGCGEFRQVSIYFFGRRQLFLRTNATHRHAHHSKDS